MKTERRNERIEEIQQNSAGYIRFLLTEPVGQRKIISAFQHVAPPIKLDNNTEITKEMSDIMAKFGLIKNQNQSEINTQREETQRSPQHIVEKKSQSISKSASPVKRRQGSLNALPSDVSRKSGNENRSPLKGSILMDNSLLGASFTETFRKMGNEEKTLDKSLDKTNNEDKGSPLKKEKKVYVRANTQIKLRIQEKLEHGTYLCQNDRLYGNIIKQYNVHRPDKILKTLRSKHQDYEDDFWKRMEAAKGMADKQIDRLYRRKQIPSTEHISTFKAEESQRNFMVEMTNLFQSRQNIIGPDGEPINVIVGAAVRAPMRSSSQPHFSKNALSPRNKSPRNQGKSKEKDVIYIDDEKSPQTERVRTTVNKERGNRLISQAQDRSLKTLGKKTKIKQVPFQKTENIVMNYINEEIHRFRETSEGQSGLHTKSKLFNYSIWQIYGKRPRENAFLRMLELKSRTQPELLANSPIKLVPRPKTSLNESSLILTDKQHEGNHMIFKYKK